jgi:type I restriction enzyme R subunit
MKTDEAVAEVIENNVRRLIINESPVDPAYYDKMSKLLDALIELRRKGVVSYKEYLAKIAALTKDATLPGGGHGGYPESLKTTAQRALYNNLSRNESLALAINAAVLVSLQDGWRHNSTKTKRVRNAIRHVLSTDLPADQGLNVQDGDTHIAPSGNLDHETDRIMELVKHQNGY